MPAFAELRMNRIHDLSKIRVGKRIAQGVTLLDDLAPPDWRYMIHEATLDISRGDTCVTAHIYGDFITACRELHIDLRSDEPVFYGLKAKATSPDEKAREYEVLRRGWLYVIRQPVLNLREIRSFHVAA